MEVTRKNFKESLPLVESSIKQADFLVIDAEFTGLINGPDVSIFDSPAEYYLRSLAGSKDFMLIQFGLCAFYWDETANQYMNDAYNFYLFPRGRPGPERMFLCQSSSLDFLASQGFNFNKLIRDGISYMTEPTETRLREMLTERQKSYANDSNIITIPEENKQQIEEICTRVRQFIDEKKSDEMEIDRCNAFIRRLLFQELGTRFKNEAFVETKVLENKNRVLKVSRIITENEGQDRDTMKKEKEWEEFEDAVGFSKVARMISQSEKLVVGHNMLLDLLHTLGHFFQPPPPDYASFKEFAHCMFPRLEVSKCFELSITPMAEKLFDENNLVRAQVTQEVGCWMLTYKDRYSFWHRMIPLLLTSMSDVMDDIRETAAKLWKDVGLQYMDENEEDLKKRTDFLKDVPSHYPDVPRPNLGCRMLAQSNIGKIVPAIAREMEGWQADARLRVAQLLCWLILCAEEGSTQHANTIVRILHRGASDDDPRVLAEIKRASELFGYFIAPDTWWPLLEAEMDSWGALHVVAGILRGSLPEPLQPILPAMCNELADPDRCRVRKPKYQTGLLYVSEAILDIGGEGCLPVADQLFTINFTVYAMPVDNKMQFMALSNLDKLRSVEKCGASLTSLYERHIRHILANITSDALTWNLLTPDRCLFECVLTNCGSAMSSHLHLISPLLKEALATPKVDAEVKLNMFTSLSRALLKKQDNFRKCDRDRLEAFLKIVVEEVILPNLVWTPGRTAEAIRTAAVACLCSALQENPETELEVEKGGDGDKKEEEVNLFPTKESLEPFLELIVPLLTGLVDDNSALTRQHSLRAICCLATLAKLRNCFKAETLHKLYFVVLKRLDDSNDKVRRFAVHTLTTLFKNRPMPYDPVLYGAHIDALYSAMLIHLDDAEEDFRKEMLDALMSLSDIDARLLMKKVKANIQLYRNKAAYERLSSHIEKLLK